jgi:GT2 family glycosyltransferase
MKSFETGYEVTRELLAEGRVEHALDLYELLFRAAQAVGSRVWMSRALNDLAALAAEQDRDTAKVLLQAAQRIDGDDPEVLENLAALELEGGDARVVAEKAGLAFRANVAAERWLRAASSLDLWRCAAGMDPAVQADYHKAVEGFFAQLVAQRSAVSSQSGSGVLLVGHAVRDQQALELRVAVCRARGETPFLVSLTEPQSPLLQEIQCVDLEVQDAEQLDQALRELAEAHGARRTEILSASEPCLWSCAGLLGGGEVTIGEQLLGVPQQVIAGLPPEPSSKPESNGITPPAQPISMSVIIPCYGRGDALVRLLHSLDRQTLDRDSFEVIVVDDGSLPALKEGIPEDLARGIRILRQENAGPASARNRGLEVAQGDLVVFLNGDAHLAPEALERHLREHQQSEAAIAVMGSFDPTENCRSLLVDMCQRGELLFPTQNLEARVPLEAQYFWTCNTSVPRQAVLDAGGFDSSFRWAICEDVELGVRLVQRGVHVRYVPEIVAGHDHPLTLDSLLERARWLGHEWVRLCSKHGSEAPPLLGDGVLPTEEVASQILTQLLREEGMVQHYRGSLETASERVDQLVRQDPGQRESLNAAVEDDLLQLLRRVYGHELKRGVLGGILGFSPVDWKKDLQACRRIAAVYVLRGEEEDDRKVREILAGMPADSQLLAVRLPALPVVRLPQHDRLKVVELPENLSVSRSQFLLSETGCGVLAFLDGSKIPSLSQWRSLLMFLRIAPTLGAVALADSNEDAVGRAVLQEDPPMAVVVTRRATVEADDPGADSFLERLAQQGLPVASVFPPLQESPLTCGASASAGW